MATPTSNSVPASFAADSGDNVIDSLLWGTKWGSGAVGTSVALTYSFPPSTSWWINDYGDGEPWEGAGTLSSMERLAAANALQAWADVANITFSKITETTSSTTSCGEIRFAWTPSSDDEQAHAYGPSSYPEAGDIWLNQNEDWGNFAFGSYDYLTLLHEIGHALGLKHPFSSSPYNDEQLPDEEDAYFFTLMSYNGYPEYADSQTSFNPTTPMIYDIAAIQYLYGANMGYHAGNDTYTFNQGSDYFQTIWDAGGTDTIVWNGTTQGAEIDLRSGFWSSLGNTLDVYDGNGSYLFSVPDTVAIAFEVTIEHATGGGGDDSITGNDAANSLSGGAGNDDLYGGDGNDTLAGGDGSDWLEGEAGADSMSGGPGDDYYVVDNAQDVVTESANQGLDALVLLIDGVTLGPNIEDAFILGSEPLDCNGNELDNLLYCNAADNVVWGNDGNDSIFGDDGDDWLHGNVGLDIVYGGAGNDSVMGGKNEDMVIGEEGNDLVRGGWANDSMFGGAGSDSILSGDDTLLSGKGDDWLFGEDGNDRLDGRLGNDVLTGGGGADIFVFASTLDGATNVDLVIDFTPGIDQIVLNPTVFTAYSGNFNSYVGLGAHLIYNDAIGTLSYDADGAGGGMPVAFAILGAGLTFTGTDFFVGA